MRDEEALFARTSGSADLSVSQTRRSKSNEMWRPAIWISLSVADFHDS